MIIELGHTATKAKAVDDRPKVTYVHVPEFDDGSTHDDAVYRLADGSEAQVKDLPDRHIPGDAQLVTAGPRLGGMTHEVGGISVPDFKQHMMDSILQRQGVTQLPGHEILTSLLHPGGSWAEVSDRPPDWVHVVPNERTPSGQADDVAGFLREYFGAGERPADVEGTHWTKWGAPGVGELAPSVPDITALYTNIGRVKSNNNDGGGQVGYTSAVTGATSTTLTNSGAAWTVNQWAGYRVYAWVSSGSLVWGNIASNTSTALTVDQWYVPATPGGSAGSTPGTTGGGMVIADGGLVSAWFMGLSTNASLTPAAADTTLSTEYTTAGGGMIRAITTYTQVSGVSTRQITLAKTFTSNGSDTFPSTFYGMALFCGMYHASNAAAMPFEDTFTSATINASGDAVTVTATINGS